MKIRTALTAAAVALAVAGAGPAATVPAATGATGAAPTTTEGCTPSVPDPGEQEPVDICWTFFRPAEASARHQVPVVLHSHGWGGSRTTDVESVRRWLDAGYGVLSFDQRGFGESGGTAHVQHPDLEGRDVQAMVEVVAEQSWVQTDRPGDPRLGAIGGSYGGGFQLNGAFRNLMDHGRPVFDALAPQITWYDLKESLGPDEVPRSVWISLLSAMGAEALPPHVLSAVASGLATGRWPDGSVPGTTDMDEFFARNGPKWHVQQGRQLDIPVLFGQGATDTLFPLRQGIRNWERALSPKARRDSIFVSYNGGHVLPAVLPLSTDRVGTPPGGVSADPCSQELAGGDFEELTIRFMDEQLKRERTGLTGYGQLHLGTADGSSCTTVDSAAADRTVEVADLVSPTGVGVPLHRPVAIGPVRVAGSPYLTADVSSLGPDARVFVGLAVGRTRGTARVVQSNLLPIDEPTRVRGRRQRIDLPAVSVDVPKGEQLFLVLTPVSDTFAAVGSRIPGGMALRDVSVHLPVAD